MWIESLTCFTVSSQFRKMRLAAAAAALLLALSAAAAPCTAPRPLEVSVAVSAADPANTAAALAMNVSVGGARAVPLDWYTPASVTGSYFGIPFGAYVAAPRLACSVQFPN